MSFQDIKDGLNKNPGRRMEVSMPSTKSGEEAFLDGIEMEIE